MDLDITVEGEVRAIDDEDPLEVGEGQVVDGGDVEQGGGVPGAGGYFVISLTPILFLTHSSVFSRST